MRRICSTFLIGLVLTSCAMIVTRGDKFGESSDAFNRLLRWGEFNQMASLVSSSAEEEFRASAVEAKDVRIVDLRILKTRCDTEKGEAAVDVEVDYYKGASLQVRTVVYKQEWKYYSNVDMGLWKVESALPEFQ